MSESDKPILIDRKTHLGYIERHWPKKQEVRAALLLCLDDIAPKCPPISKAINLDLICEFAIALNKAKKPEQCFDCFIELVERRSNPGHGLGIVGVVIKTGDGEDGTQPLGWYREQQPQPAS